MNSVIFPVLPFSPSQMNIMFTRSELVANINNGRWVQGTCV